MYDPPARGVDGDQHSPLENHRVSEDFKDVTMKHVFVLILLSVVGLSFHKEGQEWLLNFTPALVYGGWLVVQVVKDRYEGAERFFIGLIGYILWVVFATWLMTGFFNATGTLLSGVGDVMEASRPPSQTIYLTDQSASADLEAKMVATDKFWKFVAVVSLIGGIALGVYLLTNGWIGLEVALLVISSVVAIWYILPRYDEVDQATIAAGNIIFWWGAIGGAVWSTIVGVVSFFRQLIQAMADRLHSRMGLVAMIVLAPLGVFFAINPEILVFAKITKLVFDTGLTMDAALTTLIEGSLFGLFGITAVLSLINVVIDLGMITWIRFTERRYE